MGGNVLHFWVCRGDGIVDELGSVRGRSGMMDGWRVPERGCYWK